MDNIASNITNFRRKAGLTQKDLGDMLNVSPQAVSKWENGQAEPDTATIKKLCSIFKISTDELLGVESEAANVQSEEKEAEEKETPHAEQKIINGYCEICKKPVGPGEYQIIHTGKGTGIQHIYCNECHRQSLMQSAISEKAAFDRANKKSIIFGTLAGVGVFVALLLLCIFYTEDPIAVKIVVPLIVGIGYFAFVMQVFWDGVVIDVFEFFLKSFALPGVIFTLDLDGIIFLIAVKVLGTIFLGLISVLWFLVGLLITPIIAIVVLPFAAISRSREGSSLKKRVEQTTAAVKADQARKAAA